MLTDSNHIERKTGTNFTEWVQRIRLRPVKPPPDIADIETTDPNKFQLFDDQLHKLMENDSNDIPKTIKTCK